MVYGDLAANHKSLSAWGKNYASPIQKQENQQNRYFVGANHILVNSYHSHALATTNYCSNQ